MNKNKTLVLYVFHKFNKRVDYFIKNAIFYDENIDFVIICNDKTIEFECPTFVKKIFRDNIGYDFGGWSEALLNDDLYKQYDYFIFVNSSVIGPYLKDNEKKWTDVFINGLKKCKLFGSTINTICNAFKKSHVQSYIFSLHTDTLKYLIDCDIFSNTNYAKTFNDAIWKKEVLMSRKIIENNWNIGCLIPIYADIDFRSQHDCNKLTILNDLMFPQYKNVYWDEFDLIFIKGNRFGIE